MKSTEQDDPAFREIEQRLDEWRMLTEAEREAITSDDWTRLETLQKKKISCQRLIEEAELCLGKDLGLSPKEKEIVKSRLRSRVEVLLGLEDENRGLLARKMALASSQLKLSEKTIRSLRHVQQAYGTGSRSFWHAYS